MTTTQVMENIKRRLKGVKTAIRAEAPQNSKYISIVDYQPVNYILVGGKGNRVYTNTGLLHRSSSEEVVPDGKGFIHKVVVRKSQVPYYEKAVLSPTITRYFHYGRYDYEQQYASSRIEQVKNRNYKYYMRAGSKVASIVNSLSGSYNVKDDIRSWKNV